MLSICEATSREELDIDIYFPIAEVSLNFFAVLGLGGGIGLLSGLLGVGGGFLLTPLLIQIGVPAPVAAASSVNQVAGASISGCLAHWQRRNVDVKMGLVVLLGGLLGSTIGVWVFKILRTLGQIDLTISILYIVLLGTLGGIMMVDGLRTLFRSRWGTASKPKRVVRRRNWIHGLPFKLRFRRSKLYVSALLPGGVAFCVGLLSAIMGVGGGFIMVPAMIYLIGMPTNVVVGTSLFQTMFVAANITFLQAVTNQTVDALLAVMLLVGGTVGAQIGSRLGAKLKGEQLRLLFAAILLVMSAKVLLDLTVTPEDDYAIGSETIIEE